MSKVLGSRKSMSAARLVSTASLLVPPLAVALPAKISHDSQAMKCIQAYIRTLHSLAVMCSALFTAAWHLPHDATL